MVRSTDCDSVSLVFAGSRWGKLDSTPMTRSLAARGAAPASRKAAPKAIRRKVWDMSRLLPIEAVTALARLLQRAVGIVKPGGPAAGRVNTALRLDAAPRN